MDGIGSNAFENLATPLSFYCFIQIHAYGLAFVDGDIQCRRSLTTVDGKFLVVI
jgi:hypothetical protein